MGISQYQRIEAGTMTPGDEIDSWEQLRNHISVLREKANQQDEREKLWHQNLRLEHQGRWVDNNLRRLVALHRDDGYSAAEFYRSVKNQLALMDAALARATEGE